MKYFETLSVYIYICYFKQRTLILYFFFLILTCHCIRVKKEKEIRFKTSFFGRVKMSESSPRRDWNVLSEVKTNEVCCVNIGHRESFVSSKYVKWAIKIFLFLAFTVLWVWAFNVAVRSRDDLCGYKTTTHLPMIVQCSRTRRSVYYFLAYFDLNIIIEKDLIQRCWE